jgi:hypothetical protein
MHHHIYAVGTREMDLAPLVPRAIFFEFKGRRGEKKEENKTNTRKK